MRKNKRLISMLKWLHINRLVIVLFMFFVLLPVSLITALYVGSYVGNNRVHFDVEKTSETEIITKFSDPDALAHFDLVVNWESFRKPISDINGDLSNGRYIFKISYQAKDNFQISNVTVTPVLQTPWTDIRYIGQQVPISTLSRDVAIDFNHELPTSPLWFIKIHDPILYMKVSYTRTLANQTQIQEIVYVKLILTDLNPNVVVS